MNHDLAPTHHPALDLLARYRAIFAAAWQARHELAGPKRLADEIAFLPAALALQETPVHPAPHRTMWASIALFSAALAWSIVGQVDIIAVAPGRIVVSDGTKVVQPLEAGIVKAILVKDGDHVQAGQVLIELDPTTASADRETVLAQTTAARAEEQRARALLKALGNGAAGLAAAPPAGADAQAQAEWADIAARLMRLDAEITRRQAEGATAREALAKLQATVPLARQREADLSALAAQGFVSIHAGQDRTRERMELERDLATQTARIDEADATLAESRHARAAYLAEARRGSSDRLTKATLDLAQLQHQSAKTAHREQITLLRSPVAGTVQQLAVRSTGGVVTPAQALLVVVPDDAEMTAEVTIENKDIGFVRVGQVAQVKLEAFDFTRYGTVPAVVLRVSADAIPDEKRGAVFAATLQLAKSEFVTDDVARRFGPGLGVIGEIHTGRRRIIEFLLSPLTREVRSSGRER